MSTTPSVDAILNGSPPPDECPIEFPRLEDVDHPILVQGIAYWRSLCAGRKYPMRSDVTLRGLASLMHNTLLLRVIDGGRDYEYRFEGDAHVQAQGVSIQGRQWSDVSQNCSSRRQLNKMVYNRVVADAAPLAVHGWMERDSQHWESIYREGVYLPLGPVDGPVEHILGFSVYFPRPIQDQVS
jgi:hypothetical protein